MCIPWLCFVESKTPSDRDRIVCLHYEEPVKALLEQSLKMPFSFAASLLFLCCFFTNFIVPLALRQTNRIRVLCSLNTRIAVFRNPFCRAQASPLHRKKHQNGRAISISELNVSSFGPIFYRCGAALLAEIRVAFDGALSIVRDGSRMPLPGNIDVSRRRGGQGIQIHNP